MPRGLLQGDDFSVRGGIIAQLAHVVASADDFIFKNTYRANGNIGR